jgi:nitrate reductase NapE component
MSSDAGKPQKRLKSGPDKNDPPQASVPSPALLQDYACVGSELPELVVREWGHRHRRQFWFALVALVIGGLVSIGLIGGFVYLVMNDHPKSAALLLGSGALGMVAGFRSTRLD